MAESLSDGQSKLVLAQTLVASKTERELVFPYEPEENPPPYVPLYWILPKPLSQQTVPAAPSSPVVTDGGSLTLATPSSLMPSGPEASQSQTLLRLPRPRQETRPKTRATTQMGALQLPLQETRGPTYGDQEGNV